MTRFVINNGYVNTSIQKAGILGFPGCIEHTIMLWDQIKTMKNNKSVELYIIWLDLENTYDSVRHQLPTPCTYVKFSNRYSTNWQKLNISIMMGCVGGPNSLTNVALYSSSVKLKLPTLSFVEEYKFGKARFFQMLRDSCNPLVKNIQPSIITGQKWKAKIAVENAELVLKMKEIIGTVANWRAGLGLHPQHWSKESTINKRKMVLEEIHHLEEVRCIATTVG